MRLTVLNGSHTGCRLFNIIGIVGGIVLGTAAIEAALTSNFLLIIVALSALASFTTPIFEWLSVGITINLLV